MLIIDKYIPFVKETIGQTVLPDWQQVQVSALEPEEITPQAVRNADALMVRTRTKINRELLEGSSVRLGATATIGYDHIDQDYCRKTGIAWLSCPGCNAQAEHDEMASAILVTTSQKLAEEVSKEVDGFVAELSRKEIIQKSLDQFGYILVADDMETAIATANEIAPEHLEIITVNPFETMTKIRNAGAIFLGEYSSEPLGDYFAGPNHVLPTNGTAKFFSPLGVDAFVKKSSIISYSREALQPIYRDIVQFAECEQLTAHANSIRVRFEDKKN